ncbi:class I histocompatibility antigen, F10 alpha chain-like isoform X2 [Phalacrocorax carbo]|uniref:class I histocompatibility antigen, F10 alpha chain-like isoform X2 n=1 Tax=Phalacrocorax carbo TaxID=9209 RepID=UPI0031196897
MERGRALGLGLLLGVLVGAASGLHSLHYFDVCVSEPSPGVPRFTSMGYVDKNPFVSYDSETGKTEPRARWMAANMDQQFWDSHTQMAKNNQEVYQVDFNTLQHHYNQSGGTHTLQCMYGCDLLEDGSTRGFSQWAYDGRDFIAFDMNTMTFTAADVAAQVTKRRWEEDGTVAVRLKHYLESECIEWLRKYVSYGRAVLERKEPPTVRVSGKEAQGILTLHCRAYGFYPRPIAVSWLKDGEVRDAETERGSVAPNSDGTYYTWASIEARPEDKDKYRCRVEHASLLEPGLFAWEPESKLFTIVLVVALAILFVTDIACFTFWKWKAEKNKKGYDKAPSEYRGRVQLQPLPSAGAVSWLWFLAAAGISPSPTLPVLPLSKAPWWGCREEVVSPLRCSRHHPPLPVAAARPWLPGCSWHVHRARGEPGAGA